MSDQASQQAAQVGGWWMASDGKWYPPELHPSVTAGSDREATAGESAAAADPAAGAEPTSGPPSSVPELTDTAPATADGPTGQPTDGTADGPAGVPEAAPHLSRWTETARVAAATTARAKGGTQLPDMLQQAMGDDGGDVPATGAGRAGDGDGESRAPAGVTTAGSGTPGVGEFTGASARRRRIRWR